MQKIEFQRLAWFRVIKLVVGLLEYIPQWIAGSDIVQDDYPIIARATIHRFTIHVYVLMVIPFYNVQRCTGPHPFQDFVPVVL